MISDPNIYRAAKLMIERRGKKARVAAARCVANCVASNDAEGVATWDAILAAIIELRRAKHEWEKVN